MKSIPTKVNPFSPKGIVAFMVAVGLMFSLSQAGAVVVSPVQSPADPLKLPHAGLVNTAGSDAASAEFMVGLPRILTTITTLLPEQKALSNPASMALNPASLMLTANGTVRVYFIKEGAANHNSLGLNVLTSLPTASTPAITSSAELLFPDVSTSAPGNYNSTGNSVRTSNEPLLPGDFVDLGQVKAGSLLDFFLIAYGATGGTTGLTDETARNSDNIQHIVTFTVPGSDLLFVSFEDTLKGGDKDYNDAVFAVQITYTPEPGTWAGMGALGLYVGGGVLRRKKKAAELLAA